MSEVSGRRRRRTYSAEFKAEAVAACRKPGVSMAALALERSMNANVLRRWVVEAERTDAAIAPAVRSLSPPPPAKDGFIAIPIPPKACDGPPILLEIRRGALTVSVQWPASAMRDCALWLQEVLK
jgi:hypothetical protein